MHTTQCQKQMFRTSQEIDYNIGNYSSQKMKLALDNHIRLGDGGESAVEWVYFSRGQEALKLIFYKNRNLLLPVIK